MVRGDTHPAGARPRPGCVDRCRRPGTRGRPGSRGCGRRLDHAPRGRGCSERPRAPRRSEVDSVAGDNRRLAVQLLAAADLWDRPDVVDSLHSLLASEGLGGVQIVQASARTGEGVPEDQGALKRIAAGRHAAADRLSAEVSGAAMRLAEASGPGVPGGVSSVASRRSPTSSPPRRTFPWSSRPSGPTRVARQRPVQGGH